MFKKGSFFVVWLSDEGARHFLGRERPPEQKSRWAVIGKLAVSDGPGTLGLWMTIDRIEEREFGSGAKTKKNWTVKPKTCLIRHGFILSAQYLDKGSDTPIGFKTD